MSRKKVLVAMSGGVDSSVAAALLVEQGFDVVGVTMQVWDYSSCDREEGYGTCCSSVDVDDARAVADQLGFPFYVLNCESHFKTYVIDPFVSAYLKGQTPSPCVNCNTYLKFNYLVQKMAELNCDYLATGHYARVTRNRFDELSIVTSSDSWKDQTYFLFTLKSEILPYLLFPVGDLDKASVRKLAEKWGFTNSDKKDSTGICFVGAKGYAHFIEGQISQDLLEPGLVKHYPSGEILSTHSGIHHFTYGQRRGLGFSHHRALFVLKIDSLSHDVWVGDESYLFSNQMELKEINWVGRYQEGETITTKIRFHHQGAASQLVVDDSTRRTFVQFQEPQRAITPGQAAVFYRGNELLGGGWIV